MERLMHRGVFSHLTSIAAVPAYASCRGMLHRSLLASCLPCSIAMPCEDAGM